MASWCSSGARTEPAFTSESGVAPSMSSGLPSAAPSTAASLPRWALSSAVAPVTKRRAGSSPGVREGTTKPGAVERDAARPVAFSATFAARKRNAAARGSSVRPHARSVTPRCPRPAAIGAGGSVSHFSGLAGVEARAPAVTLPPSPGRAERCRGGVECRFVGAGRLPRHPM
jgi:hypothetical protein